jgi:hypothetical protein
MDDDAYRAARERIAAQRGELRGWRPLPVGNLVVTALQVLGMAHDAPNTLGLRVVIAGPTREAIEAGEMAATERALRARAVLGADNPLLVVRRGPWHEGAAAAASSPVWRWLVVHVPAERLPAIAGLATDTVPGAP